MASYCLIEIQSFLPPPSRLLRDLDLWVCLGSSSIGSNQVCITRFSVALNFIVVNNYCRKQFFSSCEIQQSNYWAAGETNLAKTKLSAQSPKTRDRAAFSSRNTSLFLNYCYSSFCSTLSLAESCELLLCASYSDLVSWLDQDINPNSSHLVSQMSCLMIR